MFFNFGTNLARGRRMPGTRAGAEARAARPRSDHLRREGAPAPWILGPLGLALTAAVCLWLLLNLVNDQAARLVIREGLRVIAVARMHPHA